jgi:hypothetical protein
MDKTLTEGQQVSEVINRFKDIDPFIQFGNPFYRRAALDMIKIFGYQEIINTVEYYKQFMHDKYCPVIMNPSDLKKKYPQLIMYFKKQQKNNIEWV